MKKARTIAVMVVAGILLVATTVYAFANAPEKGSMGVWGYVASADEATLSVGDQPGARTLVVDRASAPDEAWIVVHADEDGMPGERVGLAHIDAGASENVRVDLKNVKTEKVIVAIHADKGTLGKFDFDMEDKEGSADRPYFVNEAELAKVVAFREFGVKDKTGTAAIEVDDQKLANGKLLVAAAAAPTDAWVVVHLNNDGMPGKRVGLQRIPAGTNQGVVVRIDPKADLSSGLLVAVHADRGTAGKFDFDMEDKLNSADQPFFVDGKEVATAVTIR